MNGSEGILRSESRLDPEAARTVAVMHGCAMGMSRELYVGVRASFLWTAHRWVGRLYMARTGYLSACGSSPLPTRGWIRRWRSWNGPVSR